MTGLDCWGFIKLVYRDLGYDLKDLDVYEIEGHLKGKDYFSGREEEWELTSIPKQYDVVLFLNQHGIAYHAGMITAEGKFIHCAKNTGVAIINFDKVKSIMRVDGYYRLKARNDSSKTKS